MVFWGVSETVRPPARLVRIGALVDHMLSHVLVQTTFRTLRIREPYVKKLLIGRSAW